MTEENKSTTTPNTPPVAPTQPPATTPPVTDSAADTGDDIPVVSELDALKSRATLMGLRFHPNIGLEALREKVNLHIRSIGASPDAYSDAEIETDVPQLPNQKYNPKLAGYTYEEMISGFAKAQETAKLDKAQQRNEAIAEAGRLIRVRLTCRNPNKRDLQGEIITVSNAVVGTYKKFVPFNIPEGWHIPNIMYQTLKERLCQVFVSGTDEKGQRVKKAMQIPEFAIEVLDPMTPEEIKKLAQRQAMAKGDQIE